MSEADACKVLVVDDDPVCLEMLVATLDDEGVRIVEAASGKEAVELAQAEEYAAVFLDVCMSEVGGFEAASQIRKCEKNEHVPILFITGAKKEDRHMLEGYYTGAVDYLFKPVNPLMLKSKAKVFVGLYRQRKRLEREVAERKQAEEALRQSEDRLSAILSSLPIGIAIIDPETRTIRDINPAAVAMIGACPEEIVGQSCHRFFCGGKEGKCPLTDLRQGLDLAEAELRTAEGKNVPIVKSVVPLALRDGKHLLESFIDLTEQKRAEKESQRADQMATVAKTAVTYNHEINNPLQAIVGLAELMLHDEKEPHNREMLKSTLEQAYRIREVVRKLDRMSQPAFKQYSASSEMLDLDSVVPPPAEQVLRDSSLSHA